MPSYRVIKNLSSRKIVVLKKVKKKNSKHTSNTKREAEENVFIKSLKYFRPRAGDVRYDDSSSTNTWKQENKINMKSMPDSLVQNQNDQYYVGKKSYQDALPMRWKRPDYSSSTTASCNCRSEEIPLDYKLPMPVRPVANCIEVNDEAIKRVITISNTELRLQNYLGNIRPSKSKENFLSNHPYNVVDMLPTTNFQQPICNSTCNESMVGPVSNFSNEAVETFQCSEERRCYSCEGSDFCNCFEGQRKCTGSPGKLIKSRSGKSSSKPRVCSHCGFCEQTGTRVGIVNNCKPGKGILPVTNFSRDNKFSRIEKRRKKHSKPMRLRKHPIQRSVSTQSPSFSETSTSKASENILNNKNYDNPKSKPMAVVLPSETTDSIRSSTSSTNSQKEDDIIITLRNTKSRGKSNLKKSQSTNHRDSDKKQKRIKFVDILFSDISQKNSTGKIPQLEEATSSTTFDKLDGIESLPRALEYESTRHIRSSISNTEEEPVFSTTLNDEGNYSPVKSPSNNSNLSNSSAKDFAQDNLTSSPNASIDKKPQEQSGIKNHIKCLLDSWSVLNGNQKKGFGLKKKIFGKKSRVDQTIDGNILVGGEKRADSMKMLFNREMKRSEKPRNINLCNYSTHATTCKAGPQNQQVQGEIPFGVKKNFVRKSRRPKTYCSFFKNRFNKMKNATRIVSKNSQPIKQDHSKNRLLQHDCLPYIDEESSASRCVPFTNLFSSIAQRVSKEKEIFKFLASGPVASMNKYSKTDINDSNYSHNNSHDNSENSRKNLPSTNDRSQKFKYLNNSQSERDSSRRINQPRQRNEDNRSRVKILKSNLKTQNHENRDLMTAFDEFMNNYRRVKTSKHDAESGSPFKTNDKMDRLTRKNMKNDFSKNVQRGRREVEKELSNKNYDKNLKNFCKKCSRVSSRSSEVLNWLQKISVGKDNDDDDGGGDVKENQKHRQDEFAVSMVEQVKSLAIDQLKQFFRDPESEWNKQLHECFNKATNILNFFHECIQFEENLIAENNENNCRGKSIKHFPSSRENRGRLLPNKSMQTSCVNSQFFLQQNDPPSDGAGLASGKKNILRPSVSPNKIRALERAYDSQKGTEPLSNHELDIPHMACTSSRCVTNSDVHKYGCPSAHPCHTWCSVCRTMMSYPVSRGCGAQEMSKQSCSHTRDCLKWLGRDYYTNISRTRRV